MEIFSEFNHQENTSVILGFFDGIHQGHKAVISTGVKLAKENGLKSALVTFNEAPAVFLKKKKKQYILTKSEKIKKIEDLGVDYLYLLDFNDDFSKITASNYLKMLVENLHPKMITSGYNHYFGYNKSGNSDYLKLMQKEYNYKYTEVQPVKIKDGIISSSKIRESLLKGDLKTANYMLGYRFYVKNEVIEGQQLARTLGFNTANLLFPQDIIELPNGVYAVEVNIDDKNYIGIANYGSKPTVTENNQKILEVHIMNFDKDIYGKCIKVSFLDKIRDEKKFDSLTELKKQIAKDIECLEL